MPTNEKIEVTPKTEIGINNEITEEIDPFKTDCILLYPDTSVSNIRLRDIESAQAIINDRDEIDNQDQYHFYSKMENEILTMTQHPGDGKYQISIFKVQYSDTKEYEFRKLNIETFITEKGIKLGLDKLSIIGNLGNCYVAQDSSQDYIELFYKLQLPADSNSKILQRYNMPIYFASYKFRKNILEEFEFGFEYP